eukprot:TRINITY_DN6800_c0_g1_i1.p1 TRINITY_DN6800_c0_g1~~TRINITY_DN6800_c0_g1_i1.p1  ORF type:complete len:735 (-),score=160.60 TRINITY_DN6800_c0_g1_i1:232-2436(-)
MEPDTPSIKDNSDLHFQSTWIKTQLKSRENEFTTFSDEYILVGSWNVNSKKPSESLSPWLKREIFPVVVAVGLQELDMSAEALLLEQTAAKSEPWEAAFFQTLNGSNVSKDPSKSYKLISQRQLCGVFMCVYIREDMIPNLSTVRQTVCTTGIMGIMGNKGGVGIRFQLYDSTISFVCSHFNAFQSNVERRNQDFSSIYDGLLFPSSGTDPTFDTSAAVTSLVKNVSKIILDSDENSNIPLAGHDAVFWLGDLNYRIDLPDAFVRQKIKENDLATLLVADQLKNQMDAGRVFQGGWKEAPINFAPTYKYDNNSTEYDTSEKHRIPAWTDRILWNSEYVDNISYERHELLSSDHRPISALFKIKLKKVDRSKRQTISNQVIKELDQILNAGRPDIQLSTTHVSFNEVHYGHVIEKEIQVENVGKTAAQFQFIPKLEETSISKPWLKFKPKSGIIEPGGSIPIKFSIKVDKITAPRVCVHNEKLNDIVILNFTNGPDIFIDITGKYQKSSFGNSLVNLCRFPNPIRYSHPVTDFRLKIPKELWRIFEWLYKNGLTEEDLFLETGTETEIDYIRECLDRGVDFTKKFSALSMGELLLKFLESMRDPVIPYSAYVDSMTVSESFDLCIKLVSKLPEAHYNTFYYVIAFLRELLLYSDKNKLTAEKLGFVFSSVIIRSPPNLVHKHLSEEECNMRKSTFILHFIKCDVLPYESNDQSFQSTTNSTTHDDLGPTNLSTKF